jgi:hypothetical protein
LQEIVADSAAEVLDEFGYGHRLNAEVNRTSCPMLAVLFSFTSSVH